MTSSHTNFSTHRSIALDSNPPRIALHDISYSQTQVADARFDTNKNVEPLLCLHYQYPNQVTSQAYQNEKKTTKKTHNLTHSVCENTRSNYTDCMLDHAIEFKSPQSTKTRELPSSGSGSTSATSLPSSTSWAPTMAVAVVVTAASNPITTPTIRVTKTNRAALFAAASSSISKTTTTTRPHTSRTPSGLANSTASGSDYISVSPALVSQSRTRSKYRTNTRSQAHSGTEFVLTSTTTTHVVEGLTPSRHADSTEPSNSTHSQQLDYGRTVMSTHELFGKRGRESQYHSHHHRHQYHRQHAFKRTSKYHAYPRATSLTHRHVTEDPNTRCLSEDRGVSVPSIEPTVELPNPALPETRKRLKIETVSVLAQKWKGGESLATALAASTGGVREELATAERPKDTHHHARVFVYGHHNHNHHHHHLRHARSHQSQSHSGHSSHYSQHAARLHSRVVSQQHRGQHQRMVRDDSHGSTQSGPSVACLSASQSKHQRIRRHAQHRSRQYRCQHSSAIPEIELKAIEVPSEVTDAMTSIAPAASVMTSITASLSSSENNTSLSMTATPSDQHIGSVQASSNDSSGSAASSSNVGTSNATPSNRLTSSKSRNYYFCSTDCAKCRARYNFRYSFYHHREDNTLAAHIDSHNQNDEYDSAPFNFVEDFDHLYDDDVDHVDTHDGMDVVVDCMDEDEDLDEDSTNDSDLSCLTSNSMANEDDEDELCSSLSGLDSDTDLDLIDPPHSGLTSASDTTVVEPVVIPSSLDV